MGKIFLLSILFFILISLGYLATANELDPDFGWHLRTGEIILEKGIPKTDYYSFSLPDFPWINHEWLTDILIYKTYSLFGFKILLLFFLFVFTLAFLILIKNRNFQYFLFPILIGYLASLPYLGVRPQLITIFFVAIFWLTINQFLEKPNFKLIYLLPILFIPWVNLHGGFFSGLLILFLILILEIFKKTSLFKKMISWPIFKGQKYQEKTQREISLLFFLFLSSFLATLINPWGIRIYQEVFRTIFDPNLRFYIVEWLPLFSTGPIPIFAILYLATFLGLFLCQSKEIEFNQLVLTLLFLIFSLSSQRHFLIFIILTIPIFAQLIFYFQKKIFPERLSFFLAGWRKWLLILIILATFGYGIYPYFFFKRDFSLFYPAKALATLKELPLSENLLNEYDWGGYLIWKIPERKVFIDGRMPSWRKNGQYVFGDYLKIMRAEENFKEILEKYELKIALLKKGRKIEGEKAKKFEEKGEKKILKFFEKHQFLAKILGLSLPERNIYNELIKIGWQNIYEDETAIILRQR